MKIIFFSRREMAHAADEIALIFECITRFGFDYAVNGEFAPKVKSLTGISVPKEKRYGDKVSAPDYDAVMVCYGGDGTLLEGVHRLDGNQIIPVVGINSGHLGFLTSVPKSGIVQLFENIASGKLLFEPRSAIAVRGDMGKGGGEGFALNEVAVQRLGSGMIAVETYVDGQMVATYHGDGVIISTPTGSTAYSLSTGGPVVSPRCSCFVISPLAPHNLTMRPVVVPDSSRITIIVRARRSDAFISLDNQTYGIKDGAEFALELSSKKIFLAVPHNISFYDTLRDKMMWGVDIRS